MKRFFALLLVCAMVFTLLPLTSFAAEKVAYGTSGDLQWVLTDNGTLTFSGEGAMADYASSYDTPWVSYASQITKIVFEDGVTHIGEHAFCSYSVVQYSNLIAVEMSDVVSIGTYAFRYDRALTTVDFGTKLETIGDNAFSYCTALGNVTFPNTLRELAPGAFRTCSSMTEVILPQSVESINDMAFYDCTGLNDVSVPSDVSFIGTNVFKYVPGVIHCAENSYAYMYSLLNGLRLDVSGKTETAYRYATGTMGDLTWNFYADGTLEITGEGAMDDYTSSTYMTAPWINYSRQIKKVIIDEDVTHVGACAFYNNSSTYYPQLTEVEILGNASIGASAFKYGDETSVIFSGEGGSIGEAAFAENPDLAELVLPEGLTEIGDAAFRRCKGLTELVIPDSVTEIGTNAFYYCIAVESISFDGEAPAIGSNAFYDVKATAYYHKGMESWTEDQLVNYGGTLTWVSFTYESSVTAATCTEDGYTTYSCTHCDFTYTDDYTDKLGHDYVPVITAATCTAQGYTTYTCSRCKDSYVVDYTEKVPHDCTAVVTAPTCTAQGYTTHSCKNCDYSYVDTYVDELGHDYAGVVTPATCTAQGYTTYTCSRCKDSYVVDYTEKVPHDCTAVVTAPTCTAQGYTTHSCKNCDYSYVDTYVDELGHDYAAVVTEPTCTEDGYTTYTCSRCKDSYVGNQVPALGHDYTVKKTAPTCTKEGIATYTCARCGDTYSEVLSPVSCPTKDYVDVPAVTDWGHAGIDFCVDRGIMGSNSGDSLVFEPGTVCTRAMIVTILYRLSGSPETAYENAFPDVPDGKWYSVPVIWGYQNDVVNGFEDGAFRPEDQITREQMAAILMRYAQNVAHKDTSASTSLDAFPDAADVTWSRPYVQWAVAVEMLLGTSRDDGQTILDPQGQATRVQVASLMMRFIQNIIEQ